MFNIANVKGGKMFSMERDVYTARVYVPDNDIPDVINLGYDAPYFIIFEEVKKSEAEIVEFAITSGLSKIASEYGSSVVFVSLNNSDWNNIDKELFVDLIANSKIGPVYENGVLINKDRFGQRPTTYAIRGAIFRTYLYGYGKSADYIANNLCDKIDGEYLWGPGEITPTAVCLCGLSSEVNIARRDIPVISAGNSDQINNNLKGQADNILIKDKFDYEDDYYKFLKGNIRWCGNLVKEQDFNGLNFIQEYGVETVKTSSDNSGEYAGTTEHEVGYFAWYNKDVFKNGKVPMVMVSHGGGDSCLHIAKVSGWWEIAHKYNFLLIAVENHTSVTATETVELIEKLKKKYQIDESRMYASGFSMGGCKTWDMLQEYPDMWAALAPMDATFEVGLNLFGKPAIRLNRSVGVPVFYSGGEVTPLPELPFQAEKCHDRIKYLFEVNHNKTKYDVSFEDRENWPEPIWGIAGDRVEKYEDKSRNSVLTIHYFSDVNGDEKTALAGVSGQGHECRQHTCEHAWLFMSKFSK